MNANQSKNVLGEYGTSAISDEERIAILADIILEAISLEAAQA